LHFDLKDLGFYKLSLPGVVFCGLCPGHVMRVAGGRLIDIGQDLVVLRPATVLVPDVKALVSFEDFIVKAKTVLSPILLK